MRLQHGAFPAVLPQWFERYFNVAYKVTVNLKGQTEAHRMGPAEQMRAVLLVGHNFANGDLWHLADELLVARLVPLSTP